MNAELVIASLELPVSVRVGQRVAKKLRSDNGAVTSADKRHINDAIEELTWVAALSRIVWEYLLFAMICGNTWKSPFFCSSFARRLKRLALSS
ncbi:MAG: DUF4391 domain-containing protein [Planctomycetaceae bacterium]|nr:DUF4391 domain-containing protein [Planctomycetaceae bacterium]